MSNHEDTIAEWLSEAATDLVTWTPRERMDAVLKWTGRVGETKGRVALADRNLRQEEHFEQSNRFRADAMPSDAARQMVLQNAPGEIAMSRARATYAEAVGELEVAERIARLLERPRTAQAAAKPGVVVLKGGKR